jgi:3-oxoacyl-[acyl-carrier-protein] synthase II
MQRPGVCVVVTGVGSFSAIGKNSDEMAQSLRAGRSGIGPITLFDTANLKVRHAAEINYDPNACFSAEEQAHLDRTTQFALIAAREAVADSKLDFSQLAPERIALITGVCSGAFPLPDVADMPEVDRAIREISHVRTVQTAKVAKELNIHGLQASISTACASSTTALAYAFELLQAGKADVALVGGADGLLYLTFAGFYALGAMPPEPCSPFSTNTGVSFGEGAGFVVLESLERAQKRGSKIYGEIAGYGCTGDAYHITSPHPSGEGLRRAMEEALLRSEATVDDIDYVNAHGTGTRDNDTAESLAVSDLCNDKRTPPPMSSTKSFYGHTLGAAGILEFITCLLAARDGFLPPTLQFVTARPGCDLDYVPNQARKADVNFFLTNSAAFGGVNTVVAGRLVPRATKKARDISRIVITGIGIVSPAGCGVQEFREALAGNNPQFSKPDRFDVSDCTSKYAGLVRNFKPRQLTPTLDVRRLDLLNQYASVSAGLAYTDSCLSTCAVNPERIGSVLALAAGPVGTTALFEKDLEEKGIEGVGAKYFPAVVMSTVGGQVCQTLSLKGINSTIADGVGAGLVGAIHAFEMLRASKKEDQIIVVAPDEISKRLFRTLDLVGLMPAEASDMKPYQANSQGFVLGEGSVALVLERLESAKARGARIYAEILGCGSTCDTRNALDPNIDGKWIEKCMSTALRDAHTAPNEIDFAVGLGSGIPIYDEVEQASFEAVLGRSVPLSSPVTLLGLGLASSGAAALAMGAMGLFDKKVYLQSAGNKNAPVSFRKSLVFGSSEIGNRSAMVLGIPE